MCKKRILWLYNHNTLMKSEVKLLLELGYEVYAPKIPPFDVSIAVDWELDKNLSVPQNEIDVLNQVDFYTEKIPMDAMRVMNEYFDMVIMGVFIEPLKSIILNYKGIIIFHPFGLENGMSYTGIIESQAGRWLLREIEKLGTRFWFGQSYDNLSDIECTFFKERAVFLPIGLLDSNITDEWTGERKKMLFICPRIRTNPYYKNIYDEFKKNMGDIPHSIGGAQQLKVEDDDTVLGYLPQDEYEKLYPSHSVMFYHSREERHVHYHPFEAIKCGLPLVYMSGGLLDHLGGKNLPGRCETIKEARRKCKRIIAGDEKLANKIRKSQEVLLAPLSYDFCKSQWKSSMKQIEEKSSLSVAEAKEKREHKLALILPLEYKGGVLDYAIRLTTVLYKAIQEMDEDLKLVFAYPEGMGQEQRDYFKTFRNLDIDFRMFKWEIADAKRMKELYRILGYTELIHGENNYCLCNDRMKYFEDCDALLFFADRVPRAIFSTSVRYGVIIHDYIQRYVSDMLKDYMEWEVFDLVRHAEANFTTGLGTLEDAVQYGGVKRNKMNLLPRFFDEPKKMFETEEVLEENYFVWPTNMQMHKNHAIALDALDLYYKQGGTLKCYMTGVETEKLEEQNQNEYISGLQFKIRKSKELQENLNITGYVFTEKYNSMIEKASFVFHPGYADNGNGAVVDAAFMGVPSCSSDYRAMREMKEQLDLTIEFFDYRDADNMARVLLYMEKYNEELKKCCTRNTKLKEHSVNNIELCKEIYTKIKSGLNL